MEKRLKMGNVLWLGLIGVSWYESNHEKPNIYKSLEMKY